MANATANRVVEGRFYTGKSNLPLGLTASAHIYRNTLGCLDVSTGLACAWPTSNSFTISSYRFTGINLREVHNLATAQAHIKGDQVALATEGTLVMACTSADITWQGKAVYAFDDSTVRLSTGSNELYVGRCIRFVSSTSVEVEIDVDQSAYYIG